MPYEWIQGYGNIHGKVRINKREETVDVRYEQWNAYGGVTSRGRVTISLERHRKISNNLSNEYNQSSAIYYNANAAADYLRASGVFDTD